MAHPPSLSSPALVSDDSIAAYAHLRPADRRSALFRRGRYLRHHAVGAEHPASGHRYHPNRLVPEQSARVRNLLDEPEAGCSCKRIMLIRSFDVTARNALLRESESTLPEEDGDFLYWGEADDPSRHSQDATCLHGSTLQFQQHGRQLWRLKPVAGCPVRQRAVVCLQVWGDRRGDGPVGVLAAGLHAKAQLERRRHRGRDAGSVEEAGPPSLRMPGMGARRFRRRRADYRLTEAIRAGEERDRVHWRVRERPASAREPYPSCLCSDDRLFELNQEMRHERRAILLRAAGLGCPKRTWSARMPNERLRWCDRGRTPTANPAGEPCEGTVSQGPGVPACRVGGRDRVGGPKFGHCRWLDRPCSRKQPAGSIGSGAVRAQHVCFCHAVPVSIRWLALVCNRLNQRGVFVRRFEVCARLGVGLVQPVQPGPQGAEMIVNRRILRVEIGRPAGGLDRLNKPFLAG